MNPLFRKPRRITITIPDHAYRSLLERSCHQGRSISNLAAFLLERAIASAEEVALDESTARNTPRFRNGSRDPQTWAERQRRAG